MTHPHLEGLIPDRLLPDDGNGDEDAYNSGWNACIAEVARRLAALPGGGVEGWIACNDRMPERKEMVQVYLHGGENKPCVCVGQLERDYRDPTKLRWLTSTGGFYTYWGYAVDGSDVTHWRPLSPTPNPHEAERNE